MAECSPQELLSAANCFNCLTPGQLNLVNTALLVRILQVSNPMAAVDYQSLLNDAGCFNCLTPWQLTVLQTQLLCMIAVNGSGGGGTCLTCGPAAPTEAPTCDCSLFYVNDSASPDAGKFYFWSKNDTAWIPFG